jgi:hypothetical protein
MSKSSIRIALAAAALAAIAASGTAHAGMETVVITAPAAAQLPVVDPSDRDAIAGEYRLSDGRTLVLRTRGHTRFVAEIDGVPGTELLTRATHLSSADKRMTMRFNRDRDDVTLVTVSLAVDGGPTQTIASLSAPKR